MTPAAQFASAGSTNSAPTITSEPLGDAAAPEIRAAGYNHPCGLAGGVGIDGEDALGIGRHENAKVRLLCCGMCRPPEFPKQKIMGAPQPLLPPLPVRRGRAGVGVFCREDRRTKTPAL